MGKISEYAEDIWNGSKTTYKFHPFGEPYGIEKISDSIWFSKGFSNSIIVQTSEGLVNIDPGASFDATEKIKNVRKNFKQPTSTVIFTHGHIDHVFGVKELIRNNKKKGAPPPKIIAHKLVQSRFDRYKESLGLNLSINRRQFLAGHGNSYFPNEFTYPDIEMENEYIFKLGELTFEIFHDRGETDDAIWVFIPEEKVLCPGDFLSYGVPNAGNPQKVQRYAKEWGKALLKMASKRPKIILPGHGFPIFGEQRVKQVLEDTGNYLLELNQKTLDIMNQGKTLDDCIHQVKPNPNLAKKTYLQPIYDEPEFIVRNIWRLYHGWYDGIPSHLKPAPESEQAQMIAELSGGVQVLLEKAQMMLEKKNFRMACHLAEWAYRASPSNEDIAKQVGKIFAIRAKNETSTMAVGVFLSAARDLGYDPDEMMPGAMTINAQQALHKSEE